MRSDPHHLGFVTYVGVMLLLGNIGYGVAQLVAILNKDAASSTWLFMCFVSFSFALGGGIMFPAQFPPSMQWMVRGSVAYYAFEALLNNEMGAEGYGKMIMRRQGMHPHLATFDIVVLGVLAIVLRILVYILFRFFNVERR